MRFLTVVLSAALVAIVGASCGSSGDEASSSLQTTTESAPADTTREAAPALAGTSLDGEPISLGDFRGRPVLINVWSSW